MASASSFRDNFLLFVMMSLPSSVFVPTLAEILDKVFSRSSLDDDISLAMAGICRGSKLGASSGHERYDLKPIRRNKCPAGVSLSAWAMLENYIPKNFTEELCWTIMVLVDLSVAIPGSQ